LIQSLSPLILQVWRQWWAYLVPTGNIWVFHLTLTPANQINGKWSCSLGIPSGRSVLICQPLFRNLSPILGNPSKSHLPGGRTSWVPAYSWLSSFIKSEASQLEGAPSASVGLRFTQLNGAQTGDQEIAYGIRQIEVNIDILVGNPKFAYKFPKNSERDCAGLQAKEFWYSKSFQAHINLARQTYNR